MATGAVDLPNDIRPRGADQLDQSPPTCPVSVGVEEGNHTGYEFPADINRDQPRTEQTQRSFGGSPALYE